MTVDSLCNRPGPNSLKEAENFCTTDIRQCVKLRIAKEGLGSDEPLSIPGLLKRTVNNYPDYPALRYRTGKRDYQTVTYRCKTYHNLIKILLIKNLYRNLFIGNTSRMSVKSLKPLSN